MRDQIFIRPCSPFSLDASAMIDELDEYQRQLYPAESNHLDSRQTLSSENCKFLGAFYGNLLVGIGAVKKFDSYGELKRFFVHKSWRGKGIAELLALELENWLIENNINQCCLETGIHQKAAIRLYEKLGYLPIKPFGSYRYDPLSIFMGKQLPFV